MLQQSWQVQSVFLDSLFISHLGTFHCRVATFSQDICKSLDLRVFGECCFNKQNKTESSSDTGTGPKMTHIVEVDKIVCTCRADNVFPLPMVSIWLSEKHNSNNTLRSAFL